MDRAIDKLDKLAIIELNGTEFIFYKYVVKQIFNNFI